MPRSQAFMESDMTQATEANSRLSMYLGFLEHDPDNLSLLSDAAEAALLSEAPSITFDLLARYAGISPLTDRERNLAGLAAIRQQRFTEAADLFQDLVNRNPGNAPLQFNLAWSLAMSGRKDDALAILGNETVQALGQAAALRVQVLHDQGRFDEAAECARDLIATHPDHSGLLAVTSTLAMDVDDVDLARETALRAGPQPDALVTLGLLSLDADDIESARAKFSEALTKDPASARGWIGAGLVALADGDPAKATASLQKGAEIFSEHVGSWVATAWAQLLSGNLPAAEASLRRAQALDPSFAETQGSLAVVMFMTGRSDEGRRLAEVSRRLDPKSLTGALAQALALAGDGTNDSAKAIIDRALRTPVTLDGRTLQQVMRRLAVGP
jgi:tetratricopeptide (TPR) repeat protein